MGSESRIGLLPCALLALLPSFAGCAIRMDLPDGFLRLQTDDGRVLKATTPDDARLWVRQFDDPHGGDLQFWTAAVRADFVDSRGYEAVGEPEALAADGTEGRLQEFRTTVGGRKVGYLIAIWVRESWWTQTREITVAEFSAAVEQLEAQSDQVRAALATLAF